MKTIGLIGGIASGKSAVAGELATLGAIVLDADAAAHEVISSPSVQQALVERWGEQVIGADGQTDRSVVASRVFTSEPSDRTELRFLEQMLHPKIREIFEEQLAKRRDEGTPAVVIDAPLLLEAGWENLCDYLVFVDSPRQDRLDRARLRKWTEAEFDRREAFQMPIAEKRERATHILDNSGSLTNLQDQVSTFWNGLNEP